MRLKIRKTISDLESSLAAVGTPERAEGQKRYLKSDLEFHGVTLPEIRKIAKPWIQGHPDLPHAELVRLVEALWRRPVHELRMTAIELLTARLELLGPGDVDLLEWMLRRSKTWAYVDPLAINVVGDLAKRYSELETTLDRWSSDEDFWIRRSAMLALLPSLLEAQTGWDRFSGYADAMLEEAEFFIRKAIGWILREISKRDPARVSAWVSARIGRISGVSLREAVKYLPEPEKERLLTEYRSR